MSGSSSTGSVPLFEAAEIAPAMLAGEESGVIPAASSTCFVARLRPSSPCSPLACAEAMVGETPTKQAQASTAATWNQRSMAQRHKRPEKRNGAAMVAVAGAAGF